MKQMFSIYVGVGERFCGYIPIGWDQRNNDTHAMLLLAVSEEEYIRARSYTSSLCTANIGYNYVDLALCGLPSSVAARLGPDVDPHPIPKTMYCSQAAILILRNAIVPARETAPLVQVLTSTNSRACSPMMLYNLLSSHCSRINVAKYVNDRELTPYTHND